MSTDPKRDYVDLMLDVVAFRWSKDASDRAWREPALIRTLDEPLGPDALAYLEVRNAYNRAYWGRVCQTPIHRCVAGEPVWDGWSEECDLVWLPRLGPLEARLTEAERACMQARNDGFTHWVIMDSVLREQAG